MIYTDYTFFGTKLRIPLVTYTNQKVDNPPREDWTDTLVIVTPDDWYALMSWQLRGKTVRVVEERALRRCRNA